MKSKSHRSQPAHTPTFAFSAFPSPTAGIWNTFRRSPSSFTFFFFLHFSSSSPFTQTSFQSLLPSHSALSIFVWSALCLCKDKCKQIFCGGKSSISTWNDYTLSSWWHALAFKASLLGLFHHKLALNCRPDLRSVAQWHHKMTFSVVCSQSVSNNPYFMLKCTCFPDFRYVKFYNGFMWNSREKQW